MKKLLLFCAIIISVFVSCDPHNEYYFNAKNSTESNLLIEIEHHESVTIKPDENHIIYELSNYGNAGDYYEEGQKMSYLEMKINNKPVSNTIWERRYWEDNNNSQYSATYTLTITDELLEAISL